MRRRTAHLLQLAGVAAGIVVPWSLLAWGATTADRYADLLARGVVLVVGGMAAALLLLTIGAALLERRESCKTR